MLTKGVLGCYNLSHEQRRSFEGLPIKSAPFYYIIRKELQSVPKKIPDSGCEDRRSCHQRFTDMTEAIPICSVRDDYDMVPLEPNKHENV